MKSLTEFINENDDQQYIDIDRSIIYEYQTKFQLECSVLDLEKAQEYLQEDDMTEYLIEYLNDEKMQDLAEYIQHIYWNLIDESSGNIILLTFRKLTSSELRKISEWVNGQNADGIGEGFEQQPFACYVTYLADTREFDSYEEASRYWYNNHKNYGDDETEEEDIEEVEYVASFDWRHNKYPFKLVHQTKNRSINKK